ncbi:MAG: site-2 protease family protein, partial [Candidatus Riflebacteria bacterium]|nr:site-2 protease family protein [Candidatus Riflebacteria bacterium]
MGFLYNVGWWILYSCATVLYFLVVISIIATIHELGHYIICKLTGVRVDEAGLGFGQLLASRRWGETLYC